MIPKRPYFLRAFYDWITDNGFTAHLVVDANYQGVSVPQAYVENGKIVLNASMSAVQSLVLDDEYVSFSARFAGKPFAIYLPIFSILGVYAAENGEGIVLAEMDGEAETSATEKATPAPTMVVASSSNKDKDEPSESAASLSSSKKKSPAKRPSHLKVVK